MKYMSKSQFAFSNRRLLISLFFTVLSVSLALVGLGAIGSAVAQRAKALGMKVVALRQHPEKPAENVTAVYGPQEIPKLLAQ